MTDNSRTKTINDFLRFKETLEKKKISERRTFDEIKLINALGLEGSKNKKEEPTKTPEEFELLKAKTIRDLKDAHVKISKRVSRYAAKIPNADKEKLSYLNDKQFDTEKISLLNSLSLMSTGHKKK